VHPPPTGALARLDHGFRELIERCPRPVLAVPQMSSPMQHALLAFDGSRKAREALFVATYVAAAWQIPLTVVTVFENGKVAPETLLAARLYLENHKIAADTIAEKGPVAEAILRAAEAAQADLITMGGYGLNPMMEVVLGSAVDMVLRAADKPVLICR
jgi:nucleotide-binding universal stress UspA family protein